jgi:hypothetical protein
VGADDSPVTARLIARVICCSLRCAVPAVLAGLIGCAETPVSSVDCTCHLLLTAVLCLCVFCCVQRPCSRPTTLMHTCAPSSPWTHRKVCTYVAVLTNSRLANQGPIHQICARYLVPSTWCRARLSAFFVSTNAGMIPAHMRSYCPACTRQHWMK